MVSPKEILIDLGSTTVKVYEFSNNKLYLLLAKSFHFKEGFTPQKGISQRNKKRLFKLITKIRKEISDSNINIYATAVFRKLSKEAKSSLAKEFKEIKVNFYIISQRKESEYLQRALIGKYHTKTPLLLINIGGGSTELVVVKNSKVVEKKDIDMGVSTLSEEFPKINDEVQGYVYENIMTTVLNKLPKIKTRTPIAFLTGRELTYMIVTKYRLSKNNLFSDSDHKYLITLENYAKRNKDIFYKLTLKQLEKFLPDNPKWMHGARAYCAFAQAICQRYGVEKIIPSDSNLINGVVRKDFV